MMSTTNNTDVTATGASETPEPAVGGRCSPQVSSSPASTQSVEVLRQASTASNGAGRATVGEGAKQALSSGRKAAEVTVGNASKAGLSSAEMSITSEPRKIPVEHNAIFSYLLDEEENLSISPDIVNNEIESIFKDTCPNDNHTQNSIPVKRPVERNAQFSTTELNDNSTQMVPLDTTIDEINFIFDHMVPNNVHTQCNKIKKTIPRKYLPWLSKYLVNRLEDLPEFDSLLILCLERFNSEPLNDLVYSEACQRINSMDRDETGLKTEKPLKSITPDPKKWLENHKTIGKITTSATKSGIETAKPLKSTTNHGPSSKPLIAKSACTKKPPLTVTKPQNDDDTIVEPPENVQKIIELIFNDMNRNNVKNKCAEAKDNLEGRYLPWFSVFLTKRICDSEWVRQTLCDGRPALPISMDHRTREPSEDRVRGPSAHRKCGSAIRRKPAAYRAWAAPETTKVLDVSLPPTAVAKPPGPGPHWWGRQTFGPFVGPLMWHPVHADRRSFEKPELNTAMEVEEAKPFSYDVPGYIDGILQPSLFKVTVTP